jgi:hypothetical protein
MKTYYRALLVTLLLMIAFTTCSAQQIEVYVVVDSVKPLPVDQLDSESCSLAQPCSFFADIGSRDRYYDGLSIKLIFSSGSYYLSDANIQFGTSADLTVSTIGPVQFDGSYRMQFGNSTHPVGSFTLQDAEIEVAHVNTNGLFIHAATGFTMSNVTIQIPYSESGPVAHVEMGADSGLVLEKVHFAPYYYPTNFLELVIDTTLDHFTVTDCLIAGSDSADFLVNLNTPLQIGTIQVTNTIFGGESGSLVFDTVGNSEMLVEDLIMTDCDFSPRGNGILGALKPKRVHISNNNFAGLQLLVERTDGELFECWYNEFGPSSALTGAGYAQVNLFANFYDGSDYVSFSAETFWSQYDQVQNVPDYSVDAYSYAVIDSAYFRDSQLSIDGGESLEPEVYITYTIFERYSSSATVVLTSKDITLHESEFYDYAQTSNIMRLYTVDAEARAIPIYGSAVIAGLQIETLDATYINYGFLSITKGLVAFSNASIYNSGILAFIAHPVTSAPVSSEDIHIKGPHNPASESSVIAAVVWKTGDASGEAAMSIYSGSLDPTEHFLEVIIENGDTTEPVNGSAPLVLMRGIMSAGNFSAVYPSEEYAYDLEKGFTGYVNLGTSLGEPAFFYHVTSYSCPNDCSGHGSCLGVNSCECNPTYSGYSCGCHDLPANIYCRDDVDNFWSTDADLSVDDSGSFEFPDGTGGNVNGSVVNNGRLTLKGATYDVSGALLNNGQLTIISTISQVRNTTVGDSSQAGCVYVPTSRSFAKQLQLKPGSNITVEIDMASAASSTCPNGNPSTNPVFRTPDTTSSAAGRRRDPKRDAKAFLLEKRALLGLAFTSALPSSSSATVSKAAKSKAMLEADSTSVNGSTMIVNLRTAPTENVEITLLASRNATADTVPLLVKVNSQPGTCTSVSNKPNLVVLFAGPCGASPPGPASPNKNTVKWYYYAAPIIAVVAVIAILVIIVLTVPSVRNFFNPYKGSN